MFIAMHNLFFMPNIEEEPPLSLTSGTLWGYLPIDCIKSNSHKRREYGTF